MRYEPLDYQLWAADGLRDGFRKGLRRAILCMLMGAGKTYVAMELMRLTQGKGKRSLFLCDRRLLVQQALERALEHDLDAGIILSGYGHTLNRPCQFASKQTLTSWLKRGAVDTIPFDLVIVDECHRAVSETWNALRESWPNAYFVGLTATPCLGNGDGMGAYYDFLVQPIKPSELRARGRIVPVRAFAPHVPDLKGVKRDKDGDYSARDLSARLTRKNLVGDVSGWWKKLGESRPSIYFACDIAHSMAIVEDFMAQGVQAVLICDETSDLERIDIRKRLENGAVNVVVNCDVLAEGIDWPFVSCIGLVRPTKRLRRFLQNSGRGMRAHPGKVDCLLIDHAGCVMYHGFPDIDRDWPLSTTDNIDRIAKQKKSPAPMVCAKCKAVFSGTNKCPECGHIQVTPRKPKDYAQKNGTLVEVNNGDLPQETIGLLHQRFWGTCIGTAIKRRANAGMAAAMFRSKFGIPPWQAHVAPLPARSDDWKRPSWEVFPGFARRR